jgi:hypothetical protein
MERTRYARAKLVANISTLLGWLWIVIGALGFVLSYFNDSLSLNFPVTTSTIVLGVLALAGAQLINATVDLADNSHEILAELRKLNES